MLSLKKKIVNYLPLGLEEEHWHGGEGRDKRREEAPFSSRQ